MSPDTPYICLFPLKYIVLGQNKWFSSIANSYSRAHTGLVALNNFVKFNDLEIMREKDVNNVSVHIRVGDEELFVNQWINSPKWFDTILQSSIQLFNQ
jgi:hypothetical protein